MKRRLYWKQRSVSRLSHDCASAAVEKLSLVNERHRNRTVSTSREFTSPSIPNPRLKNLKTSIGAYEPLFKVFDR